MHIQRAIVAAALLLSLAVAMPADAKSREETRVANASDVLDQFLRIPEQNIPPSLLSRAYAIAVVPSVVKVGFGLGARRGKGVLVVRNDDGSWSNPAFITLTGGSFGFQVGAQATDVILVFKTRQGVDRIANGTLTLGADASIAAGPVGRHTGAATDFRFQAEVLSYSRSRGLFAGIALEGSGVTMDRKANAAFYSDPSMTPEGIFASSPNIAPDVANSFVQLLTAQTNRLPSLRTASAAPVRSGEEGTSESSVRTFGLPDPSEDEVEESE